jgi:small subunit ribosomal protein S14
VARKCLVVKQQRKPKFSTRAYTRCQFCGRARAIYRKFGICRICFRSMSLRGEIPGVRKASW